MWLNIASFVWRACMRFAFTTREYGWVEGFRAIMRMPVANVVAIMAGRRALFAYLRTLRGMAPKWDKTEHDAHPAKAFEEPELRSQVTLGELGK